MTNLLEAASYHQVSQILASELFPEIDITPERTLRQLGAEPADLLNILYKLGIEPTKYMTDGHLNNAGRKALQDVGETHLKEKDLERSQHYTEIAEAGFKSNEGLLELTVQDLVEINLVHNTSKSPVGVA